MVRTLNPIEEIITQSAILHLNLCALAESAYGMGPKSGAKRTILLAASRKPFVALEELAEIFARAAHDPQDQSILFELKNSGFIRFEYQQGQATLALTEDGKKQVAIIVEKESALASLMPKELSMADINKAIRCIETMRETVAEILPTQKSDKDKEHSLAV